MTSPLENAGATREPSEYATLSMDRHITGLWTQRSPLRDADVPYLYGKFYSASRFDSLIDGVNREVTAKLTTARRCGSSVYNSALFPAANSFYSYKRINSGAEIIRVMLDGIDGTIYDATGPNTKTAIFAKGAGFTKTRFQGVNTALYFSDAGSGENKKWLQPSLWTQNSILASTTYQVGTLVIDSNGKIQYLGSTKVGNITNVQCLANSVIFTFNNTAFTLQPGNSFIPSGLSTFTFLNGQLLYASSVVPSGSTFLVTCSFVHVPVASAADTGTATTTDVGTQATTGGSQPTWNVAVGGTTTDGNSTWTNFGAPVFDWGAPAAPTIAPSIAPISQGASTMSFWQPLTVFSTPITILASNGFVVQTLGGGFSTGATLPIFQPSTLSGNLITQDNAQSWVTCAWFANNFTPSPSGWVALTGPLVTNSGSGGDVLVDSNGNLQQAVATAGTNKTGASVPTWNTTYGGTTTDGGITWKNRGPYLALAFQGRKYAYAFHCIDGSVSTLSQLSANTNGLIAGAAVSGFGSSSPQVDAIWIFATVDTLSGTQTLFLASIPNPGNVAWTYNDQNAATNLNPFIVGPSAHANDPPPSGMTAPVYHLGRICAIYKNGVLMSGGPNTLVGNGNTAFPPANFFPITEQPIRLFSGVTSQGPTLFIWGTSHIWAILGSGTSSSPFQQASVYMRDVGILSYDAVCSVGSTYYAFTNKNKAVSLDPGAGYVEFGFPIGDQLKNVTTGAGGKIPNTSATLGALYSPTSTFVTWAELSSGDTGVYLSDGSVGWFRYSPVASPESGYLWSPRTVLQCGSSAVQAIETTSGISKLLIAPPAGGSGTGNTSGTTLNWVSGPKFNLGWLGQNITINAVVYAIVSVGPTSMSVNTPIGTLTGTTWSVANNTGPILFRDSTVNQDFLPLGIGYKPYPSYDVKGNITLAQSGEVAEIAHIGIKSAAVGSRPVVGLLLGELNPTTATPFDWLDRSSNDPPDLPDSTTMFSDRYTALQNGVCPKCDNFQLAIDYGTQNAADETLVFSIYGAKHAERKQQ